MKTKLFWLALMGIAGAAVLAQPAWADITFVTLETNYGDIVLELYPDDAPVTVENFLFYTDYGFYDGLIFHRVIQDFMIQVGAFDADLYTYLDDDPNTADPEWWKNPLFYHEPNEPIVNESDNGLLNERGTISMARQTDPDSANSQFFINHQDNSFLDPSSEGENDGYAVFGRVIRGMEVVDAIATTPTEYADEAFADLPVEPVIIERAWKIRSFDQTSDDFEQTPFLKARQDIERTYLGQVQYQGQQYTHHFSKETHLGIDGLRWLQTASDGAEIDNFSLLLARDTQENLWILQYIRNEGSEREERLVDPNNPVDIVPFEQYTEDNMLFRLINGNYNPDNPADPNNLVTMGQGPDTVTQQIISFSGSLPGLDVYDGDLVVVQHTEPNEPPTGWSYYHDSVGLILTLEDTSADPTNPNYYDPNDPEFTYRERTGWRLSWYGQAEPTFYPDSSDLSDVPFLHLAPGDIRVYRGQGLYTDDDFRLTASRENFLGINCLTLMETSVPEWSRPDRTLWLARDTTQVVWVFKDVIGGLTYFEAVDIDQIIPATVYPDMHLRLASGDFETGTSITIDEEPDQETTEVVSETESLETWPQFNEELVLIKTTTDPNSDILTWSYYHDSVGLVLDLWPEDFPTDAEPNQIDPNDNGWVLTEATDLEKIILKFTADPNRQSPSDSFQATGRYAAAPDDFAAGQLYVRVGPWHATIDAELLQQLQTRKKTYLVYEGSPDGIASVILLFDPAKGKFAFSGQNVDLTGLAEPVPVDIVVGSYAGAGIGQMKGKQKPPMLFLQDYKDALQRRYYRYKYNLTDSYRASLIIQGGIATRLSPIDLTEKKITIQFYSPYNLNVGDLKKVKDRNKYIYRHSSENLRCVEFDLDQCTFKVVIKQDYLGGKLPRDFSIQFDAAEDERFDELLRIGSAD